MKGTNMSNIVWMSDVRNTLTIDGVDYIFLGRAFSLLLIYMIS